MKQFDAVKCFKIINCIINENEFLKLSTIKVVQDEVSVQTF
jgi:hypothetical protein